MNEYDSSKMQDVLEAADGMTRTRKSGGGRPAPGQHLFGARKGPGEGVLPAGGMAAAQAAAPARGDRRRRLRRQPGRRGHYGARALRRSGVRTADPASLARHARRSEAIGPSANRRQLPRNREIRPASGSARRRRHGLRVDHGGMQQVLHLLRRAVYARRRNQPPVRPGAARSAGARAPGGARGDAARAKRQRLRGSDGGRHACGFGHSDSLCRGGRGRGAHPLHHLASAGVQRQSDRGLRQRSEAQQSSCICRCRAVRTAFSPR